MPKAKKVTLSPEVTAILNEAKKHRVRRSFKSQKMLWVLLAVAVFWGILFCYFPMIGNLQAFFNIDAGMSPSAENFVGLKYFQEFFQMPNFWQILRNTLVIGVLNLTVVFAAPIIFALLINEVRNRSFKKTVQTVSYLPYFMSMVVVASILFTLFSSDGTLNQVLMALGLEKEKTMWLNESQYYWFIYVSASIWQGVGWSAIIYLSAISGVDQELYEAGSVDGLGRFGKVWHITIPAILPTILMLFIMGIGNILRTGYEYQLLMGNPMVQDVSEVIDTYVYRMGIQNGRYSYSTAVGLIESMFGFGLMLIMNKVSAKVSGWKMF